MKHLKFLMIVATLLMGISMTSCLNSGNSENLYDSYGYVYVKTNYLGGVYFEDMAGTKLYPTNLSITQMEANNSFKVSDYEFAFIYVKFLDEDTTTKADETKSREISLVGFQGYNYDIAVVAPTSEGMQALAPETAPVISASYTDSYGNKATPFLAAKDVVVLPIVWALEKVEKSVVEKHKFVLVASMDEMGNGSNDLVLYLRHDKGADDKTDKSYGDYYAYNIDKALNQFTSKTGGKPSRVLIKSHETGTSSASEMPKEYTVYTIEYKEGN